MDDAYSLWCVRHGVTHAHCPRACEHPQPLAVVMNGETRTRLVCGRCWCLYREVSEMIPCTPETCDE